MCLFRGDVGKRLDAHHKRPQATHAGLAPTGMNDVRKS